MVLCPAPALTRIRTSLHTAEPAKRVYDVGRLVSVKIAKPARIGRCIARVAWPSRIFIGAPPGTPTEPLDTYVVGYERGAHPGCISWTTKISPSGAS